MLNITEANLCKAIAHYMYFYGTLNTTEGNYVFGFEELGEKFDIPVSFVEDHFDEIVEELLYHLGVLDVWGEEETGEKCFDVNFGTSYCNIDH